MNTNTTVSSSGNAVRVTPVVGADWLVRSLLPSVLMAAAGPFESDRLRVAAGALEGSVPLESAGDRYAVSRLVTTLMVVRDELTTAVRMEAWAGRGRVRLVDSFGGPARFRSVFFPELDQITTMVARTITVRGVGELLRECVNGAILLATLRTDDESDSGVPAAVAAQPVVRVYEEALRGLLSRCAAAPGRVGPVRRPVVDERFRAVPARLTHRGRGWRGEFDGPDGVVVCPHVHKEVRNARECAERLASRLEGSVAA